MLQNQALWLLNHHICFLPSIPSFVFLCVSYTRHLPGASSGDFVQQLGWCPGQRMMPAVPFLPPTEVRHLHPAGTDAAEVRPPDCPFESALAAAGSGTCRTGHNAVMATDSVVPVRQDTMQSWLVTV